MSQDYGHSINMDISIDNQLAEIIVSEAIQFDEVVYKDVDVYDSEGVLIFRARVTCNGFK